MRERYTIRPMNTLHQRDGRKIVFVHQTVDGKTAILDSPEGRSILPAPPIRLTSKPIKIAAIKIETAPTFCRGWCYADELPTNPVSEGTGETEPK